MIRSKIIYIIIFLTSVLCSCKNEGDDLTDIIYDPISYNVVAPEGYPALEVPADNPMTQAGVELGRKLFYDPLLSADGTMSCASCHNQRAGFTDNLSTSPGIDGIAGPRSSMSLVDVGFFYRGLFWDGRVMTLEDQALLPVEDPIELHNDWPKVIEDLTKDDDYQKLFREAFGIDNSDDITKELAAKAIAQFERSLVSSGNSLYDRVLAGRALFETEEQRIGALIYFDNSALGDLPDGQCFHCHGGPMLTDNAYRNNGLTEAESLDDFPDLGRGKVTGIRADNGKFRTPSLRNIADTAPYMHDGRFETLEEVMDHYLSGGHISPNVDALMDSIKLNDQHKAAVIAFLKTLSDDDFFQNPAYSDPN